MTFVIVIVGPIVVRIKWIYVNKPRHTPFLQAPVPTS